MSENRAAIVDAAVNLLREHGSAGVTTRAVAQHADVKLPTIYRLFGDKDGLLDSVAEHVMAQYVSRKSADYAHPADQDPVQRFQTGWRHHIEFGLTNPDLFFRLNDPSRAAAFPAAKAGLEVLRDRIRELAAASLLRVDEDRAIAMVHAAGSGTIVALLTLQQGQHHGDPMLSEAMLEVILTGILTTSPPLADSTNISIAAAFVTIIPDLAALTAGERQLMNEWMERAMSGLRHDHLAARTELDRAR